MTMEMLSEEIRRTFGHRQSMWREAPIIQRVFAHDVYHCAELNETPGRSGLPQVDFWD